MENIMELDELKTAWQTLDRRLQKQADIHLALFKETKLDKARSSLRPLFWGQMLQLALGIALILLGVGCWTRNTEIAGLLVSGILVHAFGIVTVAAAGITLGLIGTIDYSAPVLKIQKQMARLLHFYGINADVCGLPWWIMWVPVVLAFAGLGSHGPQTVTPPWIWIGLAISAAGLLATIGFTIWKRGKSAKNLSTKDSWMADGADGIRRSQRILDDVARFEKE